MAANSNPSASPNPSPNTDPDPNPNTEPDQVLLRRLHRLCRHARVREVHAGFRLVAITARGLPHFHRVATPQEVPGPNCDHTYPKTDSLEYSLAFSHNSYSYPPTLLVLYE